jgi:hypothetical protein
VRLLDKNDKKFKEQMEAENADSAKRIEYLQRKAKRFISCITCNNGFYRIRGLRHHDYKCCTEKCFLYRVT